MKTPAQLPSEENKLQATQAATREANARALQAREEAAALRQKLESMEALLAETRTKLAATKEVIHTKDERLKQVCSETKLLTASIGELEGRFSNLKILQKELSDKRDMMIKKEEERMAYTMAEVDRLVAAEKAKEGEGEAQQSSNEQAKVITESESVEKAEKAAQEQQPAPEDEKKEAPASQ